MSKTLNDVNLIDFMPASIKNDPKVIAACGALQPEIDELNSLVQYALLYNNIDSLPESILQFLAWENGMFGPEWYIANGLPERRELVKNSFLLNKLRGTRWSIERIFEVIGWVVEIKEWFEESAAPGTFRISLLDITDIGMDRDKANWLTVLLDSYKPASRHLTGINLVSTVPPATQQIAVNVFIRAYGVN